jgi:hypothetical protein
MLITTKEQFISFLGQTFKPDDSTYQTNKKLVDVFAALADFAAQGSLAGVSGAANLVLATPDGIAGNVIVRALVAADIPALPTSKITSGVFNPDRLGSGVSATKYLKGDSTWDFATRNINITLPNILDVTVNGYTGNDFTYTAGLASQTINTFFAAPSGSNGTPTFRTIVAADLPTIPVTKGGTGLTGLGSPLQILRVNGAGNALEYATPAAGVAGSDTWVQFNDGGALGANANFIYAKTTGLLSVIAGRIDVYKGTNTLVGKNAGAGITAGLRNSVFGQWTTTAFEGDDNIVIGYNTVTTTPTITGNVVAGNNIMSENLPGFLGTSTLYGNNIARRLSTVVESVIIGESAAYGPDLLDEYESVYNVIIGAYSFVKLKYAYETVAIGYGALGNSADSSGNTGVGAYSLPVMTLGTYNTGYGYNSGYSLTEGDYNVIVGANTGGMTTGNRNIMIGSLLDIQSATSDYQLTIGNIIFGTNISATGVTASPGNIGIAVTTPTARFHLPAGQAAAGKAPAKLTSGTALGTPEDGALEYHTSHLYFTIGSTRYQLDQQSPTAAALTRVDDTNVTLSLGGSPSVALLAATSLTLGWTGQLAVPRGGTGLSTVTQGDILYASATDTLSRLAKDVNATRYLSNTGTSNNPAWAQINLSNGVTGTLGIGNGGTGQTTATAARVALLPSLTGNALKYLRTNAGETDVEWATVAASPGGADTNIQYNKVGAFAGHANWTYNDSTHVVTLAGTAAYFHVSQTGSYGVGYKIGSRWVLRYDTTLNNFIFGSNFGTYGSITTANNNVFVNAGSGGLAGSGYLLTSGSSNVAIGGDGGTNSYPLQNVTQGHHNVAIGYGAVFTTTTGSHNIGIGYGTVGAVVSGQGNIGIGGGAFGQTGGGGDKSTSSYNIAIGWNALGNGNGVVFTSNIAIGYYAMLNFVGTGTNIAIGEAACQDLGSTANGVVVIGNQAGRGLRASTHDIAIGTQAMWYFNGMQTTTANVAIGFQAMLQATYARYQVAIGYQAGYGTNTATSVTDSNYNVYIGIQSGYGNLGNGNLFLGPFSGDSETATSNTLIIGNSSGTSQQIIKGSFTEKWVRIQDTLRFTARTSDPSSPEAGQVYYNSSAGKHKVYYGSYVQSMVPDLAFKIGYENPGASDKLLIPGFTSREITIRKINDAIIGTGTDVTWNIYYASTANSGSPTKLFTTDRTTSSESGASTTTFDNPVIPANSWVWFVTTAKTGTPTFISVTVLFTEN